MILVLTLQNLSTFSFGPETHLTHPTPPDSKPITTAECVKDLGVLVTQDLSWDSHYKLISGKAYKMLGLIRRSFSVSCLIPARRKLYISLVRSQLLYCSQIWRPSLI